MDSSAHTVRSLLEVGDVAFRQSQWTMALRAYGGVLQKQPGRLPVRLRVADALLNAGYRRLALEVYADVGRVAAEAGDPFLALVALKLIGVLAPDDDGAPTQPGEELAELLADRYGRAGVRVDRSHDQSPWLSRELPDAPTTLLASGAKGDDRDLGALLDAVCAAACPPVSTATPAAGQLPALPLFSLLDEDAFLAVLDAVRLHRFAAEEVIVRQGDRSESFFLIAEGAVRVQRDADDDGGGVTLAMLGKGAVFGELSLISDEARHASAIAVADVDVLELRRADLVVAAAHHKGLHAALKAFTRARFLRNLTATHSFFAPLSRDERHAVMGEFDVVNFAAGEPMIKEGIEGPGLFLLLGGSATVTKRAGATRVQLATLRSADVCGEMSLLGHDHTGASVTAEADLEALFLSRAAFMELVRRHPELLRYLAGLTDERLRHNRALLHARGLLEDDEHVMI